MKNRSPLSLAVFCILAIVGAATAHAVIITDDFSDNNYTSNPSWTVNAGTWSVSSGVLNQTAGFGPFGTGPGETPFTIQLDGVSSDGVYTLQSDMGIASGAGSNAVGLAFHIQDSQNLEAFVIFPGYNGNEIRLINWVGGTGTFVADTGIGFTPAMGAGVFNTMTLGVSGSSLTISVQSGVNNYTHTFSDAAFSGGGVGLIGQGGAGFFDNVSFTVPEPASAAGLVLGGVCLLGARRRRSA